MLTDKKVTFIGAGNMGAALLGGMLKAKLCSADQLMASDPREQRLNEISQRLHIQTTTDNSEAAQFGDVIVIAVKPQVVQHVLSEIKSDLREDQLLISVIPGITSRVINQLSGKKNPVIRVMPNTPAVVEEGASGLCIGQYARDEHKDIAAAILGAIGDVEVVPESLIDAVTGVSGSGPAYVFMFIEAMTDGGVRMGLPRHIALKLAAQTVLGAAKLVRETGMHPAALKDQVTTPGGTTIQAIHELEEKGLRAMMMDAVAAATKRSRELSQYAEKNVKQDEQT